LVLAIFCLLALPSPGLAGEAEWQSLLESGVSEFKAAWRTSSWKSADKHFVQAATLLEKALHEAKDVFGPNHPNTAKTILKLAVCYSPPEVVLNRSINPIGDPTEMANQALGIIESRFGNSSPEYIEALIDVAEVHFGSLERDQAFTLWARIVGMLEKHYGPDHAAIAEVLLKWGSLLHAGEHRSEEAEPLIRRGLAIAEKQFGADDQKTVAFVTMLASIHQDRGNLDLAEDLFRRQLQIYEKSAGPESIGVGYATLNLALLLEGRGRDDEMEVLAKRSLEIWKMKEPESPKLSQAIDLLIRGYQKQGRLKEAEEIFKSAINWLENTPEVVARDELIDAYFFRFAKFYSEQHRNLEADLYFRKCISLREVKMHGGVSHAEALSALAASLWRQGDIVQAESLLRKSLGFIEAKRGRRHVDVAYALNNLATVLKDAGRFVEAEPLYLRSLSIFEDLLGHEDNLVAETLSNLGVMFTAQGRYESAEPLLRRGLAIAEKKFGSNSPEITRHLNNLAVLQERLAKYQDGIDLLLRALEIQLDSKKPDIEAVATLQSNIGNYWARQGHYAEAVTFVQLGLEIRRNLFGNEHIQIAHSLNNLSSLQFKQGMYPEADLHNRKSLAIYQNILGGEHPYVANSLSNLALLSGGQGRLSDALTQIRLATRIYAARFSQKDEISGREARVEQRSKSDHFESHVRFLSGAGSLDAVAAESFEVAQWARASDTAEQVAKMAARHASGKDTLAQVARERQDRLAYLKKLEDDLLAEVSKPADKRNAERDRNLRQQEAETKGRLRALDERIAKEFPRYGELTQPKPLTIAEAQKLLGPDEALVLWLVGEKESYLWAVRRDRAAFHKLELPRAELDAAVRSLRLYLDLGASNDPEQLLARPFDAARAHALYARLLGPAEGLLKGAKHLILVPDGPLQGLPPAVLVTEAPKTPVDHREVAWLIKKYALTVLPSANSLRALRAFAGRKPGNDPLIGFGDPVLEGSGEAAETRNRGPRVPAGLVSRGALADPKEVRKMDPLPNTADELKRIAASLKAPASALHLGAQATETRVKKADLSRARVLAFATHGLMAEEFKGMAEPALVLTPPAEASAQDDGLLTAGEISQLRLNADWVVLSACNTAASDGKPGAEGLSGLARAFFYAGARALMVSHWAVETNSAAALTTGAFAQSAKGHSKAEALRRAMLDLMGRKDIPYAAHPALWAPYVVVGEGGKR
jgi:CHAT domain-containing protein/tetratricopeptide (TPR) repeat protein